MAKVGLLLALLLMVIVCTQSAPSNPGTAPKPRKTGMSKSQILDLINRQICPTFCFPEVKNYFPYHCIYSKQAYFCLHCRMVFKCKRFAGAVE